MIRISLIAAGLAAALSAGAQQVAPARTDAAAPYARAVAAGYKAAMLCSGIFNAGRTPARIERDELAGTYPEYQPMLGVLAASVDRPTRSIRVTFSDGLPPRIAAWAPGTGCTTLPIGTLAPPARAAGRPGPPAADPRAWPVGDRTGRIGRSAVDPVVARTFGAQSFGPGSKTVGVVILRDGRIVAERYAEGFGPFVPNRTWSVAKSIAGTLAGIAVGEGLVDPRAPVALAAWRTPGDPRAAVTLDNLLRMGSGLYSTTAGNRTDAIYFGGTAVTEETIGWPLETAPGARFRYANNDILLGVLKLREAMGDARYATFPRTALFDAIGMRATTAETDWRGNYILSSQVWSTARDLARLGQFWLDDGVWQGRRVLPAGWMRYMTTPSGPQPERGARYGATLWLFGPEQGLPAGSYAAQGNRGQYVMVIPSRRLVIVRRGEDGTGSNFDIAAFAQAVAAAL